MINFLTPEQAAELLKLQPRMVRRYCQRGILGQKIGGRYLITPEQVEEFIETKPKPRGPWTFRAAK